MDSYNVFYLILMTVIFTCIIASNYVNQSKSEEVKDEEPNYLVVAEYGTWSTNAKFVMVFDDAFVAEWFMDLLKEKLLGEFIGSRVNTHEHYSMWQSKTKRWNTGNMKYDFQVAATKDELMKRIESNDDARKRLIGERGLAEIIDERMIFLLLSQGLKEKYDNVIVEEEEGGSHDSRRN